MGLAFSVGYSDPAKILNQRIADVQKSGCSWSIEYDDEPPFYITTVTESTQDVLKRRDGTTGTLGAAKKGFAAGKQSLIAENFVPPAADDEQGTKISRGSIVKILSVPPSETGSGYYVWVSVVRARMLPTSYALRNRDGKPVGSPNNENPLWRGKMPRQSLREPTSEDVFRLDFAGTQGVVPIGKGEAEGARFGDRDLLTLSSKVQNGVRMYQVARCGNASFYVYQRFNPETKTVSGQYLYDADCSHMGASTIQNATNLFAMGKYLKSVYPEAHENDQIPAVGPSVHGLMGLPMAMATEERDLQGLVLPKGFTAEQVLRRGVRVSPTKAYVAYFGSGVRENDIDYEDNFLLPKVACEFNELALKWQARNPGFPLQVKDCASVAPGVDSRGRDFTTHKTHRNGNCIDIRPQYKGGALIQGSAEDRTMSADLLAFLSVYPSVSDIIYNDVEVKARARKIEKKPKVAPRYFDGHDDHIHFCIDPAKIAGKCARQGFVDIKIR